MGEKSWCLSGKGSACQCRRCWFNPWVGKIPWRGKWQPTPEFLSGQFYGLKSLVGYSGVEKSWTQLSNKKTTKLGRIQPGAGEKVRAKTFKFSNAFFFYIFKLNSPTAADSSKTPPLFFFFILTNLYPVRNCSGSSVHNVHLTISED